MLLRVKNLTIIITVSTEYLINIFELKKCVLLVLGPINSSARLRMNPKPENDTEPFSISKILLNFEMEKLAISISKTQYQNLMLLADSMGRMSCGMPYRKYRPFVKTYKGHYREWWKFAYTCVLEENVRRRRRNWDWLHIGSHRILCREYASAYQFKVQNSKVIFCKSKMKEINLQQMSQVG